jgi:alkylation response protein AidB-like acyl-CoA dehydrogenase
VTDDALARFAAGEDVSRELTMANLVTQRAGCDLIDACLQIHGGAGSMREYEIECMPAMPVLGRSAAEPTRVRS